jgi:hypothetical protein
VERGQPAIAIYCVVIGLVGLADDAQHAAHKPLQISPATTALVAALEQQGLTRGYGPYWLSSPVTVTSGGHVVVRALSVGADGRLAPYLWLSDRAWYRDTSTPFFVLDEVKSSEFDPAAITRTYGTPKRMETISGIDVYIYGKGSQWQITSR